MPPCETTAKWLGRILRAGAAGSSDRGRAAQRLAPMRNALPERALASVGQLLEIDLLEDLSAP
jgi:hypothetical protein